MEKEIYTTINILKEQKKIWSMKLITIKIILKQILILLKI